MTMVENHQQFAERWQADQDNKALVAGRLMRKGFRIRIVPAVLAPDHSQWTEYVDDGDLEITMRLELKHRPHIDFHAREDFPFDTVIVDEVYKADAQHDCSLMAYIVLNQSRTGYLYISKDTRPQWTKQTFWDHTWQRDVENYVCPLDLTLYFDL